MSQINQSSNTGFKKLLNSLMTKRWIISVIVLITFLILTVEIVFSIYMNKPVGQESRELTLLMIGMCIWHYSTIVYYLFGNTDRDKHLVQKKNEGDGVSNSNTLDSTNNKIEE